jgi:hypothetical protein
MYVYTYIHTNKKNGCVCICVCVCMSVCVRACVRACMCEVHRSWIQPRRLPILITSLAGAHNFEQGLLVLLLPIAHPRTSDRHCRGRHGRQEEIKGAQSLRKCMYHSQTSESPNTFAYKKSMQRVLSEGLPARMPSACTSPVAVVPVPICIYMSTHTDTHTTHTHTHTHTHQLP